MMNEKLKSKIISAPAGSGKTERLARRYIELLQYVEPERILTITFTDKAAAEMKERIFKILKESDPEKYHLLKEKSLQLRIQTIDSFCFSLLRRFFHLIDYQPDLEVLTDTTYLKELSMSNTLLTIAEHGTRDNEYTTLIDLITTNKFKGWNTLQKLFNALYSARLSPARAKLPEIIGFENLPQLIIDLQQNPFTKQKIPDFQFKIPKNLQEAEILKQRIESIEDFFLTKSNKTPRKQGCNEFEQQWNIKMAEYRRIIFNLTSNFRFQSTFELFTNRFLTDFQQMKKSLNQVDFADLEILAYEILTNHPEWANILFLFDEHTDHILVDEFQDTSFLQWAIISKLAEEWLSGLGAKRDRNISPTLFLVGDDKQSIYLFRNAHPEIFERAKQKLSESLASDEYDYEEVTSNYRSLQAIIEFTNHVFDQLMSPAADKPAWATRYKKFKCERNNKNPGCVELILAQGQGNQEELRTKDAELVAKKILSIIGKPLVYDRDENPRAVRYEDITILLRARTHLAYYENALRKNKIPFIVVKGIGFYDTLEITLLRAILNFLVSPSDDFSLYLILKSPLFNLTEKEIFMISQTNLTDELSSLWQRLIKYSTKHSQYQKTVEILNDYLKQVYVKPLSEIIENILDNHEGWKYFYEPQRTVNIKKFLRIVEQLESDGMHPILIADYFAKNVSADEPKANVNTEGRNEVKIMTVHAAKGLQFPIVFVVGLDKSIENKGNQELIINEIDENTVYVLYEADSTLRKQYPIFQEKKEKEYEEEKRIFYVAVTRARDALYLTGIDKLEKKETESPLKWLKDYLPIYYDPQTQSYS
ncbi:MAG: UvrD-helicase domain-containing protein, partial [candidate division WOR-3 bacterium]